MFYHEHGDYPSGHWPDAGTTGADRGEPTQSGRDTKSRPRPRAPSPTGRGAARSLLERVTAAGGSITIADDEVSAFRKTAQTARSTAGLLPEGKALWVVRRVVERRYQWFVVLEDVPEPGVVAQSIRVPASLSSPHPVVQRVRENKYALQFSAGARGRALRCLDALVKEAVRRGYRVEGNEHTVTIRVRGSSFDIAFSEQHTRVRHVPTESEIRKQQRHPWDRPPDWDITPTGRLNLRIGYHKEAEPKPRKDGSVSWRLEDRLGSALAYIEDYTKESEERERRRLEEAEERRRQHEIDIRGAEQAWAERAREITLLNRARAWRDHQMMTDYVTAVTEAVSAQSDEERESASVWLEWARTYLEGRSALGSVEMPTVPRPSAQDLEPFMPRRAPSPYGW